MTFRAPRTRALALGAVVCAACSGVPESEVRGPRSLSEDVRQKLAELSPAELPGPPEDATNGYLGDPRLAELGKQFFYEKRFSGALLDEANNGNPGTLGMVGETGKVSCTGCHIPEAGFLDNRSPRGQISLGAGWTHRRAPSLLNVAQATFLMWDGRRDTVYSQPFTPLEDPSEFNSSRLFVAQQIKRLYAEPYEAIFGPLPSLDQYEPVAAADAGCNELPKDIAHGGCDKPGENDPDVTRVVVNFGKAIQGFTRQITCGRGRFDQWMDGDESALSADEKAGAQLFVGKAGCNQCHYGPFLTDQRFHNIGMNPDFTLFIAAFDDPGASDGVARMLVDPLNSKGVYSDGYDNRYDRLPQNLDRVLGAFRTPSLRCVSRRPSFMHTGQYRSLDDVVIFFNRGGHTPAKYLGTSENYPRNLNDAERAQLVAFLKALDGEGPNPDLLIPPTLPPDPVE